MLNYLHLQDLYEQFINDSTHDHYRQLRALLDRWESPHTGDIMRAIALLTIRNYPLPKGKVYDGESSCVYEGIILKREDDKVAVIVATVVNKSDLSEPGIIGWEYYLKPFIFRKQKLIRGSQLLTLIEE